LKQEQLHTKPLEVWESCIGYLHSLQGCNSYLPCSPPAKLPGKHPDSQLPTSLSRPIAVCTFTRSQTAAQKQIQDSQGRRNVGERRHGSAREAGA